MALRQGLSIAVAAAALVAVATAPGVSRGGAETGASRPPALDPAEARPGGDATSKASVDNANAFSASSGNLSFERELDFKLGNAMFRKFWVSAPSSTRTSDGLGPIYNARSCQGCHLKDGRGQTPDPASENNDAVSLFLRLSIPPQTDAQRQLLAEHKVSVIGEPTYGGQLQNFAIQGQVPEGQMRIVYEDSPVTLGDGAVVTLRKPTYSIAELGYGPLHKDTMMSPRLAPPMIGLGLLEAIKEADILAGADADDRDGDGISGRPNRVWSEAQGTVAMGRFGWKAGNATVAQQAADAFAGDIGISSALAPRPSGDCTAAQEPCLSATTGAPPNSQIEIADDLMKLVVFYSSNLAVPPRRAFDDPAVVRGRDLFHGAGCAACHRPSYTTGEAASQPHLSNQKIWPYTDLLLHDMGDGLADNRPEGVADGREWRTPPLWGLGLTHVVNKQASFLHDGRARDVTEAILWHGGEAQPARDAFAGLSKAERDALIAFVNSL